MRDIIKDDVPYQPLPHADSPRQPSIDGECGSAEGRDVSGGGERNRRPTATIYSARRSDDEQLIIVGD